MKLIQTMFTLRYFAYFSKPRFGWCDSDFRSVAKHGKTPNKKKVFFARDSDGWQPRWASLHSGRPAMARRDAFNSEYWQTVEVDCTQLQLSADNKMSFVCFLTERQTEISQLAHQSKYFPINFFKWLAYLLLLSPR